MTIPKGHYILIFTLILCLSFGYTTWFEPIAISLFLFEIYRVLIKIENFGILQTTRIFFILQYLIGPLIAYNMDQNLIIPVYRMQIPSEVYFSFALPAILAFVIGSEISLQKDNKTNLDRDFKFISQDRINFKTLILISIAIELSFSFINFGSSFTFSLITAFKFSFLAALILSRQKLPIFFISLVLGIQIAQSLRMAMFHDLLIWSVIISLIAFQKHRIKSIYKILSIVIFVFIVGVVQLAKQEFRSSGDKDVFKEIALGKSKVSTLDALLTNSVRINQGFIITHIMKRIPSKMDFANGSALQEVFVSALVPRILAPDKINAGDQEFFTKYTGVKLNKSTSMAISPLGDGYVNFGVIGGVIFMFLYGFFLHYFLKFILKLANKYQLLIIFIPAIYLFSIRPDCELQTSLGQMFKGFLFYYLITLSITYLSKSDNYVRHIRS